jgi:hypothetical protein
VAQLPDGSYIYELKEKAILKCNSRLRARQFTRKESQVLQKNLQVTLLEADWERVQ